MRPVQNNVAYIDGANLYNGTRELDWKFDYRRFRIWLWEKYSVKTAYIFLGMIPKNQLLYSRLESYGYKLVFKEVIYDSIGKVKGNCDADLIVMAMRDVYESRCSKTVIISSDGDFVPLVKFLMEKSAIEVLLSPFESMRCSVLLKRTGVKIGYIPDQRNMLERPK